MEIKTIFQDDALLVINKPAGITVNRSDTTKDELTVQDWAESKLKMQNRSWTSQDDVILGRSNSDDSRINEESDFYNRGGIVHRLDKETSGVLIIAKTPESFVELQRQFKERLVKKTYIALAHGMLSGEGEIRVPVGRLPWNRKRFGVIAGGRESVTKYKVIAQYVIPKRSEESHGISRHFVSRDDNMYTLLELYPETGRTHQIRVHLKHINHPIFSDVLYAGRKTSRDDRKILPRVFLHAAKISFSHPITGEMVEYEAQLPEELEQFLQSLNTKH